MAMPEPNDFMEGLNEVPKMDNEWIIKEKETLYI
jgi:hypothetical protein